MIRRPDFRGVWIKVERAKHHFRDLQSRYEGFRENEPYRAVRDDESHTGDLVYRVEVSEQPPLEWSAIIGDCVHNLRSALDLLVCEMVRANGEDVTTDTAFPINKSADAFESGYFGKVKGAPECAVNLIKKSEPYEGAGNPFWMLHKIDIADKHKLLVPVGVVHASTITSYTMAQYLAVHPGGTEFSFDDMTPQAVGIIMPQRRFPLEDGQVIYRIPASVREHPVAQMHQNPEFEFEVAFGEVEVVEGQPLIPTLFQLIEFVEGFVALFPPLFSQNAP